MLPFPDTFWHGITPSGRVLIVLVLILAGVVIAGFRIIAARIAQTTQVAAQAKEQATSAADRSLPTANGWTASIVRQLERIEETQEVLRRETGDQLNDVRHRLGRLETTHHRTTKETP